MFLRVNNSGGTTQSVIGGADQKVVLANSVFDTLSGWNAGTNEYTIPASLDGEKIILIGAVKVNGTGRTTMELGLRFNGGLITYTNCNGTNCLQCCSGVIQVATGDAFYLSARGAAGFTASNDEFTFLSAYKVS